MRILFHPSRIIRMLQLTTAGVAGCLVLMTGCTSDDPTPEPTGVKSPTSTPATVNPSPDPLTVPAQTELTNIELAAVEGGREAFVDGQPAVEITYRTSPCALLSRVQVNETADSIVVGVYVGELPPGNKPCALITVRFRTIVKLKSPLGNRQIVDMSTK